MTPSGAERTPNGAPAAIQAVRDIALEGLAGRRGGMARCVMTGLALLLAAMAVHGEEGRPGLYAFDLEPQPLALALQDFMRTTRHFGLYDSLSLIHI